MACSRTPVIFEWRVSTGGVALAIAATMKIRGLGSDIPAGIIALSPFIDCTLSSKSIDQRDGDDPIVERDTLTFMVSNYFQDNDPSDPFISPIFGDFTGLPPILIQAGNKEVLIDEALRLVSVQKHQISILHWSFSMRGFTSFQCFLTCQTRKML